jgi:hypothetical protein
VTSVDRDALLFKRILGVLDDAGWSDVRRCDSVGEESRECWR